MVYSFIPEVGVSFPVLHVPWRAPRPPPQSRSVSIEYGLVLSGCLCVREERRCRISACTRGVPLCRMGLFYVAASFEWLKVSAGVDSITQVLLLSEHSQHPPPLFPGFPGGRKPVVNANSLGNDYAPLP